MTATTRIIGIASGKGGVGKTAVAANLAVTLSARGNKVMLFDADLGLANAQLALGCPSEWNFGHVLSGKRKLSEIVVTTRHGIRLVPGASGIQELASLGALETSGIIGAFSELAEDIDYLVVDAAAGISDSVITFMQASPIRFVVVRDEPSSIADAYGLIKVMGSRHKLGNIFLVPNMVDSQESGRELHRRINDVCRRFLDIEVGYLNSISYDRHALDASRAYQPVTEFAPGGSAARDYRQLAQQVETLAASPEGPGGIRFFMDQLIGSEARA
jgi:flagellar biosynthesis protein FlhG